MNKFWTENLAWNLKSFVKNGGISNLTHDFKLGLDREFLNWLLKLRAHHL